MLKMLDLLNKQDADLINGKRQIVEIKNIKFFSKIYNKIIRIFNKSKVEDHFSGIKVLKKIYDN